MQKPARRQKSALTIHDVARYAGVSPMTVSRVINGEKNVRDSRAINATPYRFDASTLHVQHGELHPLRPRLVSDDRDTDLAALNFRISQAMIACAPSAVERVLKLCVSV